MSAFHHILFDLSTDFVDSFQGNYVAQLSRQRFAVDNWRRPFTWYRCPLIQDGTPWELLRSNLRHIQRLIMTTLEILGFALFGVVYVGLAIIAYIIHRD